MNKIRVAVNGYGVIGKRVADAVRLQSDMELVGVSDVVSDYRIKVADTLGIPVYAVNGEAERAMSDSGLTVSGHLHDLLDNVDVVLDCTPKGVGAANFEHYREHGVRVVLQGGESHDVTGHSFVANVNYDSLKGLDSTRVVSCNTTATVRTLAALKNVGLLGKARGVLFRRATDPWESDHSGIMNTVVPEARIPSHQGPDAQTVIPDLDVVTMAAKGSHTQNHAHFWTVELTRPTDESEILDAFRAMPRIAFVRHAEGVVASNSVIELMRDLGRPRGDMYEVALWEDILTVRGHELFYTYSVDNQAIVIPETIDAVRALMGTSTAADSIGLTDASLGVMDDFTRAPS